VSIERLTTPWWALRVGLGAAAFFAIAAFTLARLTEAGVGAEAADHVGTRRVLGGGQKLTA
jgi:hypothetical protein